MLPLARTISMALQISGAKSVGPESVSWLEQRDEATRAKAIQLTRRGWPLGEALLEAYREEKIDWTLTPHKRPAVDQQQPGAVSKVAKTEASDQAGKLKKPRTGDRTKAGLEICKPRNDNRGCSLPCPNKRAHVCDVLLANGQPCESARHRRGDHNADRDGEPAKRSRSPRGSGQGSVPPVGQYDSLVLFVLRRLYAVVGCSSPAWHSYCSKLYLRDRRCRRRHSKYPLPRCRPFSGRSHGPR